MYQYVWCHQPLMSSNFSHLETAQHMALTTFRLCRFISIWRKEQIVPHFHFVYNLRIKHVAIDHALITQLRNFLACWYHILYLRMIVDIRKSRVFYDIAEYFVNEFIDCPIVQFDCLMSASPLASLTLTSHPLSPTLLSTPTLAPNLTTHELP